MRMRKFHKYFLVTQTSLSNAFSYSVNFFAGSFFLALIVFIFMQLWETLAAQNPVMEGYTVNRLVWYYITAELVILSKSEVFQNLNNEIRGGNIAYQFNKPYDYVLYQFSDGLGQIGARLAMNLPVGVGMGLLLAGGLEGFRWTTFPAVILAVILGILLNFFMEALIGMAAFWTEDNTAFFWIAQKLAFMLGLFLPLEFLPRVIQKIALYLPFSYIAYGPARLLTGFSEELFWRVVPAQMIYVSIFTALTYWAYRKGVKNLNVNGG
jgi:ABC-2 type transport system permease protein